MDDNIRQRLRGELDVPDQWSNDRLGLYVRLSISMNIDGPIVGPMAGETRCKTMATEVSTSCNFESTGVSLLEL